MSKTDNLLASPMAVSSDEEDATVIDHDPSTVAQATIASTVSEIEEATPSPTASTESQGTATPTEIATVTAETDDAGITQIPKTFTNFDIVSGYADHYFGSSYHLSSKSVTKKIQKEWGFLKRGLPDDIYVRVYGDRMNLLRAVIVGAWGTPYSDGLFVFDFMFPDDYPSSPPQAYYHSFGYRLNPNLYGNGKVCLSLLGTWEGRSDENWDPNNSTMLQVLISIQGLVLNAKPYLNEPGHEGETNVVKIRTHNEIVYLLSCGTMMQLLKKPPMHFENFISDHFIKRGNTILRAFQAYTSGEIEVGFYKYDEASTSSSSAGNTQKRITVSKVFKRPEVKKLRKDLAQMFAENDGSMSEYEDGTCDEICCVCFFKIIWGCFTECFQRIFADNFEDYDDETPLLQH